MKSKFLTLLSATVLALSLTGCADDDDSDKPANQPETGRGTDGEIDYRRDLTALVAGTYTGECVKFPAGEVATASIVFSPEGFVSTDGAEGSLLSPEVNLVFNRKFSNSNVETFTFNGTDVSSNNGLNATIESGTTDTSNVVGARQGIGNSPGIRCNKVANVPTLKTKSAYPVLSRYLITPARNLTCLVDGNIKVKNFTVVADTAQIGDETFSMSTNLKEESAIVLARENYLNYTVRTTDDRSLGISLDEKAELKVVNVKDKDGEEYGCVP